MNRSRHVTPTSFDIERALRKGAQSHKFSRALVAGRAGAVALQSAMERY